MKNWQTTLNIPIGANNKTVKLKIYETYQNIDFHFKDPEGNMFPCVLKRSKKTKHADLIIRVSRFSFIPKEIKEKLHLIDGFKIKPDNFWHWCITRFYKEYAVDKEFHKEERTTAPEIRRDSWVHIAKGIESQKKELQKRTWVEIITIEDGTLMGVYLKESHYNLHFHVSGSGKKSYSIEDNYKEQLVNIHIRSWLYSIPKETCAYLHLVPSYKENLSFWKKMKYLFFHYYVVDGDFMPEDRLDSSEKRLKAVKELLQSLQKLREPGKAPNYEHMKTNSVEPNNEQNRALLN